ncbi:LutC/YkgG family protein [Propylenella binzhouense]|uniref:Lactate utilization protein n=1 Tax=Propylenella binzhouense TaxID=2555902 RepID=A0A964T8L9_9HYPH|nr:lactate utilization protein [Propylenella binzhouense]MYZ50490.1 lactate utilization protein [Propylenella binzhouense]
MSGRETVLGSVRRALAAGGGDERAAAVAERLAYPKPNLIPARAQIPQAERIDLFCRMAEKVSATVERLAAAAEVPTAVAEHLRRHNLPAALRMGEDPLLESLPWGDAPQLELRRGASDGHDAAGLSRAVAGIAESGTLMLVSGPDNPATITFLPDTHIVMLEAGDVIGDLEMGWARIRGRYGKGGMPRTVNLVTGPSRSADIEQTLILGAHGPRALHILVVG